MGDHRYLRVAQGVWFGHGQGGKPGTLDPWLCHLVPQEKQGLSASPIVGFLVPQDLRPNQKAVWVGPEKEKRKMKTD